MDWFDIDTKKPEECEIIRILKNDKTEDIAVYSNGEIYIWLAEVKPITHWQPINLKKDVKLD